MKLLTVFLIVGGMFAYVLVGAGIIHGIERFNEETMAVESTKAYNDFKTEKMSCLAPKDLNLMLIQLKLLFVSGLTLSPDGVVGSAWDFPSSIFMCLQVMSGVGFGASSPKTIGGKVFLIFYTFFGLALFIATALALGQKLIHFVDWIRIKMGIKGKLRTALFIQIFRVTLLLVVGTILLGVIPAAIFSAIDPKFGFNQAFSVVSVALVGYTDILNDTDKVNPWYRLGISVWAILSLLWFTATFSTLRAILSVHNSGAIEIPACCLRNKNKDSNNSDSTTQQIGGIGSNINPYEINKQEADPYAADDMVTTKVQKAVVVMGKPPNIANDELASVNQRSQKTMIEANGFSPPGQGYSVHNPAAFYNYGYEQDDMVHPTSQRAVIVLSSPPNGHNFVPPFQQPLISPNASVQFSSSYDTPYVLSQGTRSSIQIGGY